MVNIQKSELMPLSTSNDDTSLNSLPFKINPPKNSNTLAYGSQTNIKIFMLLSATIIEFES